MAGLVPAGLSRGEWEAMAEEAARAANGRGGYSWEEMQYSWAVLYGMIQNLHERYGVMEAAAAAMTAAAPSGSGGAAAAAQLLAVGGSSGGGSGGSGTGTGGGTESGARLSGAGSTVGSGAGCVPLPGWESFLLDMYALADR